MAHKNTVAIIGATTVVGAYVAKSIAAKYRLILMDKEQPQLVFLQNEIQVNTKNADVDVLDCCKNASWEADIIAVANENEGLEELVVKMEDVSNCKNVLHFTSFQKDIGKLQQLLPNAKVVTIISNNSFTNPGGDVSIHGSDTEAMDTAKTIVEAMAFQHQVL